MGGLSKFSDQAQIRLSLLHLLRFFLRANEALNIVLCPFLPLSASLPNKDLGKELN